MLAELGYWGCAALRGGPGAGMRARLAALAAPLWLRDRELALSLLIAPMDSVRYFEFAFAWSGARGLAAALRVPATLSGETAATVRLARYDLITCISVLEHIPEPGDVEAVARLWAALKPGGRLVLTVPCAFDAFEEYLDVHEYGLLAADEAGFSFGQRFYDEVALNRFRLVCGVPTRCEVFGEKVAGTATEDRRRKNAGTAKTAREPWVMATQYRRFAAIGELPGLGVVGMEFVKP